MGVGPRGFQPISEKPVELSPSPWPISEHCFSACVLFTAPPAPLDPLPTQVMLAGWGEGGECSFECHPL